MRAPPAPLPAIAALALLLAAGCAQPVGDPLAPDADPGAIRFLVIGDGGTGDAAQYSVAEAMLGVCAARGCDFVVGNGDNIYEAGAVSAYDPQFEEKFERPYLLLKVPFFMTLGNHDIGTTRQGWVLGDFQVDYHGRSDRMSDNWQMPSRWYSHLHAANDTSALFVALDTNIVRGSGAELWSRDPGGIEEGEWVDRVLAASNETWRFAHGHHPLVSNGQHGDADSELAVWYREHLCGKVDILFSGHDHDLQWLAPIEDCGHTQFIVSGAAAKTRPMADPDRHEAHFAAGDVNGFLWAQVVGDTFTGVFYDDAGNELYAQSFAKRSGP